MQLWVDKKETMEEAARTSETLDQREFSKIPEGNSDDKEAQYQ
jgi:hypothetical protein